MVGLFFMRRAIRHDYGSPMFAMAGFGLMCVGIGDSFIQYYTASIISAQLTVTVLLSSSTASSQCE